jgi:hypothetical protein
MTLKFLNGIFTELFSQNLAFLVLAAKTIGALVVLFVLSKKMFVAFSKHGSFFSDKEDGLTGWDVLRPILLVLLIGASTELLSIFDSFLVYIEQAAFKGFDDTYASKAVLTAPFSVPLPEEDTQSKILRILLRILEVLNPMSWIVGNSSHALYAVSSMFDAFIYPFFLAKRFFVMAMVKLFFPLMIAASIFDKTKDYAFNLMKIYVRAYLSIIPMIFTVYFCNHIYSNLLNIFRNDPDMGGDAFIAISGGAVYLIMMLFLIFIKIALFKQSNQLMDKLIP